MHLKWGKTMGLRVMIVGALVGAFLPPAVLCVIAARALVSAHQEHTALLIIGGLIAFMLVESVVASLVASAIVRPLKRVTEAMERLAVGDTDVKGILSAPLGGEAGMLAAAIRVTAEREQAMTAVARRVASGDQRRSSPTVGESLGSGIGEDARSGADRPEERLSDQFTIERRGGPWSSRAGDPTLERRTGASAPDGAPVQRRRSGDWRKVGRSKRGRKT